MDKPISLDKLEIVLIGHGDPDWGDPCEDFRRAAFQAGRVALPQEADGARREVAQAAQRAHRLY